MDQPYNPCSSGLAAKIWECLRRNRQFRERVGAVEKAKDPERRLGLRGKFHEDAVEAANRFAAHFFASIPDDGPSTIGFSWIEQSAEWRKSFDSLVSGELPIVLKAPDFNAAFIPLFPHKDAKDRLVTAKLLAELREVWSRGRVVLLPATIRDEKHRAKIIDELERLLPSPKNKSRLLKPKGSVLGSETEWCVFLLFEYWTGLGFARRTAADLVARERDRYGSILRNPDPEVAKKNAKAALKKAKVHRNTSMAEQQITRIEEAIASLFPSIDVKL